MDTLQKEETAAPWGRTGGGLEAMAILNVQQCTKRFGGLVAVKDLNISLNAGDLYGLIGPNGAGKTTIFNLITGVYTPDEGTIELSGAVA